MSISLIAAIGKNNELGLNNKLIWALPKDLRFFKDTTTGKTVIMGRKTFDSIGRILPNRKNVIITSDKNFYINDQVEVYNNIQEVLTKYLNNPEESFVMGGASIYEQFLNYASAMYLTEIDSICEKADSFFPKFDRNLWDAEFIDDCTENDIYYKHIKYIRKRKF